MSRFSALVFTVFLGFGFVSQAVAQKQPAAVVLDELKDLKADGAKHVKLSGKPTAQDAPLYLHVQLEAITKRGNTVGFDGAWLSTKYTLEGLNDAALVGLADKIYAEVAADLTQGGYKVIPLADIQAAASAVNFVSKPPVQTIEGNAISAKLVTPTGLPAIAFAQSLYVDQMMGGATGIGPLDMAKGVANIASAIKEASTLTPVYEKLGAPGAVRVVLILDFADMKSSSSRIGQSGAQVSTKTSLRMSINNQSVVTFLNGGTNHSGVLTFQAPLASLGDFVTDVKDDSSTGKNILANLPSLFGGGGASRKIVEKIAVADSKAYVEVADKVITQTRQIILPFLLPK